MDKIYTIHTHSISINDPVLGKKEYDVKVIYNQDKGQYHITPVSDYAECIKPELDKLWTREEEARRAAIEQADWIKSEIEGRC